MAIFDHNIPIPEHVSQRLQIVWRNIEFARRYSLSLLADLDDDEWFFSPDSVTTHIAWQAGHLAMSQYGLTLFRQRGRNLEVDRKLMSGKFRKLFMRGTQPSDCRTDYPPPAEILEVLDRIHEQMRMELPEFDDAELDEPAEAPHAAYATRYGALVFAANHEMLHAGQIGLLRRLMGKPPLR